MKKIFAVFAVLVALAVLFVACGGGGGGGGGTTAVTTTTQGAQAAKVGASVASGVVSGAFGISSSVTMAPKYASPTKAGKAFARSVARKAMMAKRAKAIAIKRASQTVQCTDGGSMTVTDNSTSTVPSMSVSYSACKDSGYYDNGTMSISCSDGTCSGMTLSMNLTEIFYVQDVNTGGYDYATKEEEWIDNFSMNVSYSTTAATETATMTANGTSSDEYFVAPTWKYVDAMSGAHLTVTGSLASQTAYDLTVTANGTVDSKYYESGTLVNGEADTFGNLVVKDNYDSLTGIETFSIDGTITIDLTPNDVCAEGTYAFDTVTPITYNYNAGMYTAGKLVINTAVIVTYNSDGSVDVSIDGGKTSTPYTSTDLDAMCASL